MKIVVATPLYPPEIAAPAPYVKELAKRLQGRYEVTIVAYGRLPEQVPGVRIITVDKRRPLLLRLLAYTRALRQAAKAADIVYAMNGTSVELPAHIVAHTTRPPLILGLADSAAHTRAQQRWVPGIVEWLVRRHASAVISAFPLVRPEIMPLEEYPTEAFAAYEASWEEHLAQLEAAFEYAT